MQRLGSEDLSRERRAPPPVFGIAGFKNAGKTTLLVALVRELTARGFRVASIKHAHHAFDIDQPGKDSHRHREAGARDVIVLSGTRLAQITELTGEPPALEALCARFQAVDLVLAEGFKGSPHPKFEVRRRDAPNPALGPAAEGVVAIVADGPVADATVPVLPLGEPAVLADFLLAALGLPALPVGREPVARGR